MNTKICRVCGEEKPIDAFMSKGRGKSKKNLCKKCSTQRLVEWLERKPLFKRYSSLRGRAKRRGIQFDLSYDEFAKWYGAQESYDDILICFYCGRQIDFENAKNLNGATIDCFDPKLGYAPNNMIFCCRRCNIIKGNWFFPEEMLEIADKYFKDEDKTL